MGAVRTRPESPQRRGEVVGGMVMKKVKIQELRLRHYRAFSDARLVLNDITFLVGRNGAGKSTLMDALNFLSEAVTDSLATALERRGNLEGIRQRQPRQ